MEDQERGVAAPREGLPPLKGKSHLENRFTVMIMRGVGGVRSFKISPGLIFWATLFFIAYVLVSIFVIHNYLNLRRVNARQSEKMRQLEEESTRGRNNLDRARQRIAVLEEYIQNPEGRSVREERPPAAPEAREAGAQADKKITEEIVGIKDFAVYKDGYGMVVDFKLVNNSPGEKAVGGYVHVIAMNRTSRPPREWSYPDGKLINGFPANYRRGQAFLIQRFKPMRAKFGLDALSSPASAIHVLVYDQSGTVIMDKEFDVDRVS